MTVFDTVFTFNFNTLFSDINIGEIKDASHALVFMFGDIFTWWKLPVTYHFIPSSVDGAILKPIVEIIIKKTEAVGLYI